MPFGEEITRANYGADSIRQKFTGYERDTETDLDFAQARMYNKNHGRFTTVDPLPTSADTNSPQTFNRFCYVLNNPLRLTDPTGQIPTTHTDRNGIVIDVIDDGKLDVIRHNDIDASSGTQQIVVTDKPLTENMGQTEYWDEFRAINEKTGEVLNQVADGARILFGTSFDADISRLNEEAKKIGLAGVSAKSFGGGYFDIKRNSTIAPHGLFTGRLLNGKYATARSAGNYLAGYNGATSPFEVTLVAEKNPTVAPQTMRTYLDETTYMQIAGALQQGQVAFVTTVLTGTVVHYGVSPNYGELEYAGRQIRSGFRRGVKERKL